ncbi:MAG: RnfABCDGE type electron transport complex subunit D [Phycisphaerae bacterium]|jgi:electron transport complex protein RnfD|nr:RnfABCDGE type electron transport complex subunit D [Phycisphaerae bacterium]
MTETTDNIQQTDAPPPPAGPVIHVAPSPHSFGKSLTTRRMMVDVLLAAAPLILWAIIQFGFGAMLQLLVCVGGCVLAEAGFTAMRGRCPLRAVTDLSAIVTGVILAMSLPCTAPWYVGFIGACVAVGIGKVVFGGLGQNIFNPAMVGRAFVMICFAWALAAGGYVELSEEAKAAAADPGTGIAAITEEPLDVISQATPMDVLKKGDDDLASVSKLFLGNVNGSIGEVSTLACLIGGLYLCWRRTAAWQIPAGVLIAAAVIAVLAHLGGGGAGLSMVDFLGYHMFGGALMFGAFFIATDPVSSPITATGRWIFGVGLGLLIMLFRTMSTFPEGVMFAVLMMNAIVPLINRWTIPTPVGGPVPERK